MWNYRIHDILTVDSDTVLPELEYFHSPEPIEDADIKVRGSKLSEEASAGDTLKFRELFGSLGFAVEIALNGSHTDVSAKFLLRRSPHVLYTNVVEPILRWKFVERGYALVHGACISSGDRALLVTAKTDTGKTTTVLRILDRTDHEFISDDMTLLDPSGVVRCFPKPLTVSSHTVQAVSKAQLSRRERMTLPLQSRLHSRGGRKFAFFLTKTHMPVATINTVTQLLVPPPKYFIDYLIPATRIRDRANLEGMAIIERSTGPSSSRELGRDEALKTLLANGEDAYGFPPYNEIEAFLLGSASEDLRSKERAIIAAGLGDQPVWSLKSELMDWWKPVSELIAAAPTESLGQPAG